MSSPEFALTSPSICTNCGLNTVTMEVTFRQNVGFVVRRYSEEQSGDMCRRCIRAYFWSYSLTTLFLGWWGLFSFFVTPIYLLGNVTQYLRTSELAEPLPAADGSPLPEPVVASALSPTFKLIASAIAICAVVAVGAGTLRLSKTRDEVKDALLAVGHDFKELGAPLPTKSWPEARAAYLSREPILDDLVSQNTRLQRAKSRWSASENDNSPCVKILRYRVIPALDEYTSLEKEIFSVIKSATGPTPPGQALSPLVYRKTNLDATLNVALSDLKAAGCASGRVQRQR